MTNEQAIDILNATRLILGVCTDEMEEAFDMAISALKAQQAAGDTISRGAALEACYKGWNKDYKEIAQDIKDLPPAQPERTGRWIHVRNDNIAECDQCGITGRTWMNLCFNCGADMMEGEG